MKMILKPLIAATFTCLAVMSFSANAATVLAGTTMTLSTEAGSPLTIMSGSDGKPTSQVGQMAGSHLGLNWLLDYTSPLNYILINDNGIYSQGTYTDFEITDFQFTTSSTGTSTSSGVFTDSTLGEIIDVTSVGTWSGAFGGPIDWEGTGTFAFRSNAPSAVPIPAAAFLFAPALLGFMGLRRKAKNLAA
jgi:type II secretory pathway pseudopilin PulG